MPAVGDLHNPSGGAGAGPHLQQQQQQQYQGHQRTKSSVLRSIIGHRRSPTEGSALPYSATTPVNVSGNITAAGANLGLSFDGHLLATDMGLARPQRALEELQQNQQDQSTPRTSSSPKKSRDNDGTRSRSRSPTKSGFATISLKTLAVKESTRLAKSKEKEKDKDAGKPKKTKSATNLVGLLSRPKSSKNLKQQAAVEEEARSEKNKENRTPPSSMNADMGPPPPIYAQFASRPLASQDSLLQLSPHLDLSDPFGRRTDLATKYTHTETAATPGDEIMARQRPRSFQPYTTTMTRPENGKPSLDPRDSPTKHSMAGDSSQKRQTWAKGGKTTSARPNIMTAFQGMGPRGMSTTSLGGSDQAFVMDAKDIDKHLEQLLDRRNIPENQRYKMRNLNDTIKMEFIRQDWAESQAKLDRPVSHESDLSERAAVSQNQQQPSGTSATAPPAAVDGGDDVNGKKKKKHTRGRSLTLYKDKDKSSSRSKRDSASPKKKSEGTLGRHFRSRSTDSVASSDRPVSAESGSGSAANGGGGSGSGSGSVGSGVGGGLFAKVKGYQSPGDFVSYLRKVRKPEAVEVGKLHKLRLLLRNETVAWTEEFIRQGGMKEMVDLLHRIMEVEWREEHEDALLHENLLCLKALCTTALALQYLHSIHTTLFPALLHMIFDPEKKGPSEFTTRNIITSVLLTYIECATPQERLTRAAAVLRYLRDPEPKEEERPVSFVLDMRRERPYRVWCKEVVSVTKEVFWIFLHNLNVVSLPSDKKKSAAAGTTVPVGDADASHHNTITSLAPLSRPTSNSSTSSRASNDPDGQFAYMARHFPQERPPVPAAPYVGGVEWDATNYLASHLDLLNAILACTGPTPAHRNALRAELRISGWERCLGASLRTCKEKFYSAVHDGLRTWVAAAADDGWDVKDVRFGPAPAEGSRSASPVKKVAAAQGRKRKEEDGVAAPTPPKIEMPVLDLALDSGKGRVVPRANEPWLS